MPTTRQIPYYLLDDGTIVLTVDTRLYSREAVIATAYRFTGDCAISTDVTPGEQVQVCLRPHASRETADLCSIAESFFNALIDEQVRFDIEKQTGRLREIIVAHAFAAPQALDELKKNTSTPYTILPLTFLRIDKSAVLLVNQVGEFINLSPVEFEQMIRYDLDTTSCTAHDLMGKHFIAIADLRTPIGLLSTKLRTRKAFLRDFTTLHMVVLTCGCNCRCEYCHASSRDPNDGPLHMTKDTARSVVDMIFCSPSPVIKIEFQGGEPTLNWEALTEIVKYAEHVNTRARKRLEFVVCTNLTGVTRNMLQFFRAHRIMISTSLDGPRDLHDAYRIRRDGRSSYDLFVDNLAAVRQEIGPHACSPLLTVTKEHLPRLREVVDEYCRLGFNGIFLRALNPYGFAVAERERLGYSTTVFTAAYIDTLEYIFDLNRRGQFFIEYYALLLLTRILTPFSTGFVDLQSPSGAGISGVIYDYDGSIYPTDESRMLARTGDDTFRLGNVHTEAYADIFLGERMREITAHSCVETLPGCAICAYQAYCGADPIRNYVECGDMVGHRPTSEFCQKNMAIFDYLFSLLRKNDTAVMNIIWSWITNRHLQEVTV